MTVSMLCVTVLLLCVYVYYCDLSVLCVSTVIVIDYI